MFVGHLNWFSVPAKNVVLPSVPVPAKAVHSISSLLANTGDNPEGRPIIACESGDEDDDDLVEEIDCDFSVRSPWMSEFVANNQL